MTDLSALPPGQRVDVLLHRGMADEWISGIVTDAGAVLLDEEPPGMARLVRAADVADWRPSA